MKLQTWILGTLVLVSLVLGIVNYYAPKPEAETPPAAGTNAPTEPQYFSAGVNGVTRPFFSTSTIVCMAQNPSQATTTFTARYTVTAATTTTTVLAVATTTNAGRFSTTTAVLSNTIAANAKGSGSYVGANNQNLLGPAEWAQVGYGAGTTGGTNAQLQAGICSFTFGNIF